MKLSYFYKNFFFRNSLIYLDSTKNECYDIILENRDHELFPNFKINFVDFYIKTFFVGASNKSFRYLFGLPINGQRT